MTPLISVVLPVHNGEAYIREAVESVLAQSFRDFEFFVYNDRSTDSTLEILRSFNDERLFVEDNQVLDNHLALRNLGIERARGKYIAIMDGDDVCAPRRFEMQVAFLETHPQVGVCGSFAHKIGIEEGLWRLPETNDAIKFQLLKSSPLIHPTTMIRLDLLRKTGIQYDLSYQTGGGDYKLWVDLYEKTQFHNLPEPLLFYRLHDSNMSIGTDLSMLRAIAQRVRQKLYQRVFPKLNEAEQEWLYLLLSRSSTHIGWRALERLYETLRKTEVHHIDRACLFEELDKQVFRLAFNKTDQGYENYRSYRSLGALGKPKRFARQLELLYKSVFKIPKRNRRLC